MAAQLARHPGILAAQGITALTTLPETRVTADPADLTKQWLLREGMETYLDAKAAKQPSAQKAALELLAKLTGHLIERKDIRVIRSIDELTDAELEAIVSSGKMIEGIKLEEE